MVTIDHFDGSSTSIDQEPDGSWTVVTTDADGNAGGAQNFGSNYTARELTDKFTYSNDVVESSSVEHDDGSKTVIDQLGSGGWSVYLVDANGDQRSSTEYGSNYTREELEASAAAAGDQKGDSAPVQSDAQPSEPAPAVDPASDPAPEPAPEQEEGPSEGDASGEGGEGAGGDGGEGEGGGGGG